MAKQINQKLTPNQKKVLFEHGTEAPFSGKFYLKTENGTFHCANCDNQIFRTNEQYDSNCGWPSFTEPIHKKAVTYIADTSHGMIRTEVLCGKCGAHLGHVFPERANSSGQRFCINSVAMDKRK